MKIIDFRRKGNMVRFYLGEKTPEWGWTNPEYKDYTGETPDDLEPSDIYYGDDWGDRPYEDNAGEVYGQFVKGHKDLIFDFDDIVLEPCEDYRLTGYTKEEMRDRLIPCLVVIPKEVREKNEIEYEWAVTFEDALKYEGIKKFYFGDEMDA